MSSDNFKLAMPHTFLRIELQIHFRVSYINIQIPSPEDEAEFTLKLTRIKFLISFNWSSFLMGSLAVHHLQGFLLIIFH